MIIFRKDELILLRELTEVEYADDVAYFRALSKAVEGFLRDRECFLVTVRLGGIQWAEGPIWGLTQAKAAHREAEKHYAGSAAVIKLFRIQPLRRDEST